MNIRTLFSLIFFSYICFISGTSLAQNFEEISHNKIYQSNDKVKSSQLGFYFKIPNGWRGGLMDGSSVFVMDRLDELASAYLIVDFASKDELQSVLSNYIPMDDYSGLTPNGKLKAEADGSYSNQFTYESYQGTYSARAIGRVGEFGVSSIAIIIFDQSNYESAELDLDMICREMTFKEPSQKVNSNSNSIRNNNDWGNYMRGRHIKYMKTDNGLSEKDAIWLCSDGSYARYNTTNYISSGAAMNFDAHQSGEEFGNWEVNGSRLILKSKNGGQQSFTLELMDDKLYMNGVQYFRLNNERCN